MPISKILLQGKELLKNCTLAVADFRGGQVGAITPFTKRTKLGATFYGEKCIPHHDPKTLFFNYFDQNLGQKISQ